MKFRSGRVCALIGAAGLASLAGWGARAQEIYAGRYAQQTGQEIYQSICQGCHMPNAQGAVGAGAYPALAADAHLQSALFPVTRVLYGSKAMPGFGDALSDAQIANVVNYIRTHFGNHYTDRVTPAAVKAARP
ncbi:MAG TPA: cytochrome c [Steroidobacteraceae bacterium]|nr:cytochrome c [Steroidobacteraceae bacterium]